MSDDSVVATAEAELSALFSEVRRAVSALNTATHAAVETSRGIIGDEGVEDIKRLINRATILWLTKLESARKEMTK